MRKPYVIAEVGSNWQTFEDCSESIGQAKAAGADAVKFQMFSGQELYGIVPDGGWNFSGEMPRKWIPQLAEKAKARDIDFLCTAFSPDGVDYLDPYVKMHKIASAENCWPQLLDAVGSKGKPVILSCGGSSLTDIKMSLGTLERRGESGIERPLDITLLYCVSAYPAFEQNLYKMEQLKSLGKPVGLSDHSLDVLNAPLLAHKVFGARIIEKHFRLDDVTYTPDADHSLTPDQFRYMVDHLRGECEIAYRSREESEASLRHNRRLIATQPIAAGQTLQLGVNFGAFRSLKDDTAGLIPFAWQHVQGKKAAIELSPGDPIGPKSWVEA
jgi:sialic acid synthase SpsE